MAAVLRTIIGMHARLLVAFSVLTMVVAFAASARAQDAGDDDPIWSFEPSGLEPPAPCALLGVHAGCVGHKDHGIATLVVARGARGDISALDDLTPLAAPTLVDWARTTPGALAEGSGVGLVGRTRYETAYTLDGFDVSDVDWASRGPRLPLAFLDSATVVRGGADARVRSASVVAARLLSPGSKPAAVVSLYAPSQVGLRDLDRAQLTTIGFESALRTGYAVGVVSGPLWPGYLGGVAGVAADLSWGRGTRTVHGLIDEDGDGHPDRDAAGKLVVQDLDSRGVFESLLTVPYLGRLVATPLAGHSVSVAVFGSEQHGTELSRINASISAGTTAYLGRDLTGLATYQATLGHGLSAEASAGIHRTREKRSAANPENEDRPQRLSAGLGSLSPGDERAAVRDFCDEGDGDIYPSIINCPVAGTYASGGPGHRQDEREERAALRAKVSWLGRALGTHDAEVGLEYEERRLDTVRGFSGGRFLIDIAEYRYVSLGEGPETCGTLEPQPCMYLDEVTAVSRSRFIAGYLSERYAPTPAVRLDAGVRIDRQNLQDRIVPGLELLPRLGVGYDPTGEGRGRLFAGFARYGRDLPLRTADAAFSRYSRMATVNTPLGQGQATETISPLAVDEALLPGYDDEVILGAEWQLADAFVLGLSHQHQVLGRVIEDVIRNGERVITNPSVERDEVAPRRVIDATTLTLETRTTEALSLSAHYTLTYARGNYPGPIGGPRDYRAPHLQLAFDDGEFSANADGRLPADRRHRLSVAASYRTPIGGWRAAVTPRFQLMSGAPQSALAAHIDEGEGAIFLLPRGAMGRADLANRIDLSVAASRAVSPGELELFAEIFNLAAVRGNSSLGEIYTDDFTGPIVGGGAGDLVFAKRIDGLGNQTSVPIRRRLDFGQPTGAPALWMVRLGLRFRY